MRYLAVLLSSCALASPYFNVPHVAEHHMKAWHPDWFVDGDDMRLDVQNPLEKPIKARVVCYGQGNWGLENYWVVTVPAYGTVSGIGQIMNRERYTGACYIEYYEVLK